MSRSGYSDDCDDHWDFARWRGIVANTIKGKRGQEFLREMLAALDGLPERKLITRELEDGGAVCAIGAVGKARGVAMGELDPDDIETVAGVFKIPGALAKEIVWMNDDAGPHKETTEERYARVRTWVLSQIRTAAIWPPTPDAHGVAPSRAKR